MKKYTSKCCGVKAHVTGGKEGTCWFECSRCGKPCDVKISKSGGKYRVSSD